MNTKQPFIPGHQSSPVQKSNEFRIEFQKRIVEHSTAWQSCLNCEEWSDGVKPNGGTHYPMGCVLHKGMPPPEVIVHGCRDHMTDIPF